MLITVYKNYFKNLDTNYKAYLGGYFTNIKCNIEEYKPGVAKININYNKNITCHNKLMSILNYINVQPNGPIDDPFDDNMLLFIEYDNVNNKIFDTPQMSFDVARSKRLIPKSGLFNKFSNDYYGGMLDANFISLDLIEIHSMDNNVLYNFANHTGIPFIKETNLIRYIHPNTIDLFYNIYPDTGILDTKTFKYFKTDPDASPPYKARMSDSGYDLTLIKLIKKINNIEFYDTGIAVEPPLNMYFDLVARSSISKSGYMLANNIGIIDQGYRGNIIVPLIKIDSNFPDLELPIKLVQIIPRHIEHLIPIESNLQNSHRNDKKFGSSN